ncbi:ribonuclease III domain-containing protein [Aspergillus lucknowensis]|uniref:Ribonuclease III domain-containing protein n=1 Tax=Aspergillus lucknowensis TaxID=176173 RepID=A0ABR4LCH1_9EURO
MDPETYVQHFIGYTFRHRGYIKEAVDWKHNERLALLGDTVVALLLLEDWYRSQRGCGAGSQIMKRYASNRAMAYEARTAGFDEHIRPSSLHMFHSPAYDHVLATEVEAIVAAVWLDSERNFAVTKSCYQRIKNAHA